MLHNIRLRLYKSINCVAEQAAETKIKEWSEAGDNAVVVDDPKPVNNASEEKSESDKLETKANHRLLDNFPNQASGSGEVGRLLKDRKEHGSTCKKDTGLRREANSDGDFDIDACCFEETSESKSNDPVVGIDQEFVSVSQKKQKSVIDKEVSIDVDSSSSEYIEALKTESNLNKKMSKDKKRRGLGLKKIIDGVTKIMTEPNVNPSSGPSYYQRNVAEAETWVEEAEKLKMREQNELNELTRKKDADIRLIRARLVSAQRENDYYNDSYVRNKSQASVKAYPSYNTSAIERANSEIRKCESTYEFAKSKLESRITGLQLTQNRCQDWRTYCKSK